MSNDSDAAAVLAAHNIGKKVSSPEGSLTILSGVSFSIAPGESVAVVGPSGAGKSTLLALLAGLDLPSEGYVTLNGVNLGELDEDGRARVRAESVGFVFQSFHLVPSLNALENVMLPLELAGVEHAREAALQAIRTVGLEPRKGHYPHQLSGGEKQRVALARSLVTEPQILLLDEPLSALDAHLVIRMQSVLTNLQRELGITFVYVTHSQSEAFAMADRVVIMSNGEVAQVGQPKDIYRAPANRFVAEFVGRNNIISGKVKSAATGKAVIDAPSGSFTVTADAMPKPGSDATFVISADLVRLTTSKPKAENAVQAKLISEEFIGSVVTLFRESADGTEFKVQVQERELATLDLKSSDTLWLSWPAASAHLLPGG